MNLAGYCIKKKTIVLTLTVMTFIAGLGAFFNLGRLEDPEFTIKTAVVVTPYPGASPAEVEEEVTERLEKAIQQMAQLKEVRSLSQAGLSIIWADMKDEYWSDDLPQVWDELRRKVADAQPELPPGSGPSAVNDDFSDVYGVLYALTGDGFSMRELKDQADFLKRELLLVDGVAKVVLWGERQETVYVEISRARAARLGLSMQNVFDTLSARNLVAQAGRVRVDDDHIRIDPTGMFESAEDIADLLVSGGASGGMVRLRDIADIRRDYQDPPDRIMRFNGRQAIAVGVSCVPGGNVVDMAQAVTARLAELEPEIPLGMELGPVNVQGQQVDEAVNGFLINLGGALAIVIAVLLIFMGLRSGVIIGVGLLQTVAITLVLMDVYGIVLQRVSLGALILSLGMLVDNAIVVTEGILVRIQTGVDRLEAASAAVRNTAMPLLGATAIAVLAFAAIGTSDHSSGEFCGSLFKVVLISLSVSWFQAMTVTPLLCHMFLKPRPGVDKDAPYGHPIFRGFRKALDFALHHRAATTILLLAMTGLSIWGGKFINQSFFPDSTRAQFYVDYWRTQGSHIRATDKDVAAIEKYVMDLPGVTTVSSYVGEGSPRFLLSFEPEVANSSYGLILASVDDYRVIPELLEKTQTWMDDNFPEAEPKARQFIDGPPDKAKIEARFSGPDPVVLRRLSGQAEDIMRADPMAKWVRLDWRQKVKVIRPEFSEIQARQAGVSRSVLARALNTTFDGTPVGVYREGDELLPIVARSPKKERTGRAMKDIQIFSPGLGKSVPFGQIAPTVEIAFEDPLIQRRDRRRTITAQCDPATGTADALLRRIRPDIEAIPLPPGYYLEWGGELNSSMESKEAMAGMIPVYFTAMVVILIMLFNALRQPAIILLCLPLSTVGITAGLLATGQPMGFMAILGALSLAGMLIKNAIVLIDQIDKEIRKGMEPYKAVLDSTVTRVRPVVMASATTILGMAPLVPDKFFVAMAVTIMSGLAFATALTLGVVPLLYTMFFRIRPTRVDPGAGT